MTWTLRRSAQAIDDLADIWSYIAADNAPAADKLVAGLLESFDRTAEFPHLGRAADEVREGLRLLPRGNYLLVYQVQAATRTIELVRVLHGARDWPRLFSS